MRNTLESTFTRSALLLVMLAGTSALAQVQPVNGRALERDMRVGVPAYTKPANFMQELAARNALVTGNYGGGASLRIDAPYTAPNEFHGSLGSDELFTFRRDSVGSSTGFRGTQGLQFQSALTTGNAQAAPLFTRLDSYGSSGTIPRSGYVPQNNPITGVPRTTPNPYSATRDTLNSTAGTLRSTSAYTATTGLTPAIVGFQGPELGSGQITASSMLGVRFQPTNNVRDERLTARELADKPPEMRPNDASLRDTAAKGPNLSALDTSFRTSYDDLRVRLDEQGRSVTSGSTAKPDDAKKPDETKPRPTWEQRIEQMRLQIEKERKEREKGVQAPKTPETTKTPTEGAPSPADSAKPDGSKALSWLDNETLEIIRKAGGEASSYSTGKPGTQFDAHMRAGEESMSKSRYFDAEERFARALAMNPGNVTVMAARLNAQIGAGLYLSAAVNLRQLFEQHPEAIGTRYTGTTMPAPRRVAMLTGEFRESLARAQMMGQPIPQESALLLAYIGFQTNDAAAVKDGLDTLVTAANGNDETLLTALRKVWQGTDVDGK